ncbi:DegT/DnrJ/EryC1/StrS family aminotransferase [Reinekea forsetii]|jgi:dTDP-4-amino-4,6-dideoxygalactose transaminase|uniref:Glutamine--scyllo-inositol transaminase n=1 Tax=Reinekea forsetii TaxID=1336806 RepID=A0A2K8KWI0_9GAMM|nr:DegT/DnrJ/EryC1/StrS family aminotransferase [Reinekea forsetii]ATX77056.1 glutamine--scyllo-inositol transaminase [Reinekea forsetii]
MTISFFNYVERYKSLPDRLPELIEAHCAKGQFILKDSVVSFEKAIAEYLQLHNSTQKAVHCAAVSSASMGMVIALKALGIGPGDEVITPAYSYVSTASAIVSVGATPIFVDVNKNDFMLNSETVLCKITSRTKAVIAVHLYRQVMDVAALKSKLPASISIVEDSATCLGGSVNGTPTGLIGDVGVYSFFPAKPLGGLGDAGMLVTHDKLLHRKCAMYRNHGQDGQVRFTHFVLGYNSRMDDINAAYLMQKLTKLEEQNQRRNAIVEQYDAVIDRLGWRRQQSDISLGDVKNVPYSYVLLTESPQALADHLRREGIESKRGFPDPLPDQPAFADWRKIDDDFPNSQTIAQQAIALPIYPELTDTQVESVVIALQSYKG